MALACRHDMLPRDSQFYFPLRKPMLSACSHHSCTGHEPGACKPLLIQLNPQQVSKTSPVPC